MNKKDITIALLIAVTIVTSLTLWVRNGAEERARLAKEKEGDKAEEIVVEGKDLYILAGPKWLWVETKYSDGKVVKPTKPEMYSVTFDSADGYVFGTTDCNGFSASYTSGAWGTLSFGPFLSPQMFCEGSQEAEFVRMVAESDRRIFTESGDLVLLLKTDSGSVIFKKGI